MKFNSTLVIAFCITSIACFNCTQNEVTIEGDLYFSSFRIGSLYNQPDSIIKGFTIYADTVNVNTLHDDEKRILGMYDVLKKEKLLYSPFVNVSLDKDSLIILYLDKSDYDQVKIYHHKDLIDQNKKVRMKMLVRRLGYNMYLCKTLLAVNMIDGQTSQRSRKLLIEDYK